MLAYPMPYFTLYIATHNVLGQGMLSQVRQMFAVCYLYLLGGKSTHRVELKSWNYENIIFSYCVFIAEDMINIKTKIKFRWW